MSGYLSLSRLVFLHSFNNHLVPLFTVPEHILSEYFSQMRSAHKTVTLGNIGNVLPFLNMGCNMSWKLMRSWSSLKNDFSHCRVKLCRHHQLIQCEGGGSWNKLSRIWVKCQYKIPDPDMADSCQGENSLPALFWIWKGSYQRLLQGITRDGTHSATIDHPDIRGFDRKTCLRRGAVSL